MTFTPKLKAYIRKNNPPLDTWPIIRFVIYLVALFYMVNRGIAVIFSKSNFVDFNIFLTSIGVFLVFGTIIFYAFKNNSNKANENVARMEQGEFNFQEIEDWTTLSLTTNIAKTVVSFKASEAFNNQKNSSNTVFQTKFEKKDVILSIQINDNLSFQDVVEKIEKSFGTTPKTVKYHNVTPIYMYEITIHLGDVDWIKDQDIIEYEILES